jgi:NAD(P)-dependent dehydrogenase (short-subunit alcohol dehydrogenase family)
MGVLTGKRALVTGASRGIGAAIARRLATEGADVAITYERSFEKAEQVVGELKALGRNALAIQADAVDASAVSGAVEKTVEALGGLDILVNNAGQFRMSPLETLTLAHIDTLLAINVRAVVVASQAAAPHMPRGGRIVSLGSCVAERVPGPYVSLYALTKTALIGWTKGLAHDLGEKGITVNLVSPGPTDTDMNPASSEIADRQRSFLPIPEYGKPEDIAAMVAFVAGPEGAFINGATLNVDGGFTI